MTPEIMQAIVERVAERHPKFKCKKTYLFGGYAAATFEEPEVDPRRVGTWFEECGMYVVQIGYSVTSDEWYLYFREGATS